MSAESRLFSYLTRTIGEGEEAEPCAVSQVVAKRVYPDVLPLGTQTPAITYSRVGTGDPAITHDGPSGVTVVHMQVDCWASTRKASLDLGLLVYGDLGSEFGGVENLEDDYESETKLYRSYLDVFINQEV